MDVIKMDLGDTKSLSIRKRMKGLPSETLSAAGLLYHDWTALSPCQRECNTRFVKTIQMEQEAYLSDHPEIKAMLELFICSMTKSAKRKDVLKAACNFFLRPADELDEDIRKRLKIPTHQDTYKDKTEPTFVVKDYGVDYDLRNITVKHYPPPPWVIPSPCDTTPNTTSSSFLSVLTSDTTLPTPEPVPPPEPTISEIFYQTVSNAVDKAIYTHVDDRLLRYDTAFVELSKCVEAAMEVPVIEIRLDIADLLRNAYHMFTEDIVEKERIAAEIAWDKRMRKKLKRTLRRQDNFKGYETPPTPKSELSSHESYKVPPQKPCVCHPQFHYNRYAKDRFGIYLPRETEFSEKNVTATPAISVESGEEEEEPEDQTDKKSFKSVFSEFDTTSVKSGVSRKSRASGKSKASRKAKE